MLYPANYVVGFFIFCRTRTTLRSVDKTPYFNLVPYDEKKFLEKICENVLSLFYERNDKQILG